MSRQVIALEVEVQRIEERRREDRGEHQQRGEPGQSAALMLPGLGGVFAHGLAVGAIEQPVDLPDVAVVWRGRTAETLEHWIVEADSPARLVTAYPA